MEIVPVMLCLGALLLIVWFVSDVVSQEKTIRAFIAKITRPGYRIHVSEIRDSNGNRYKVTTEYLGNDYDKPFDGGFGA